MPSMLLPAQQNKATWKKIQLHLLHLKAALLTKFLRHPLKPGQVFLSPGGTFKYRVVGACCRLYDRENLPHLCCSLEWHGKQPSWRRLGKRFVPDIALKHSPSYCVQLVDSPEAEPVVMTLHWVTLSDVQQQWWYSKRVRTVAQAGADSSGLRQHNNDFSQQVA